MPELFKKKWVQYSIKLLAIYTVLYFGTQGIIGLSAPEGYYSSFVARYFNYPSLLRQALFDSCNAMLRFCGYQSEISNAYRVRLHGGHGVNVVYGCLGIGVTSFWVAFVAANEARLKKKALFIVGGSLAIFLINSIRLALLVILVNNNRQAFFITYHHAFFNVAAYVCIIFMMYLFDRGNKENTVAQPSTKA